MSATIRKSHLERQREKAQREMRKLEAMERKAAERGEFLAQARACLEPMISREQVRERANVSPQALHNFLSGYMWSNNIADAIKGLIEEARADDLASFDETLHTVRQWHADALSAD